MPKRREGSVAITTENATDWVARAEDLRGEIERLADSTEQRRTLDPEAVELLRDAGLFSIAAPSAVGGAELDLVTQTKVFEALCAADGSTGWCLLIGSTSIGLLSTYLPDEAIEEVFDGPHFPIAAGSLQPTPPRSVKTAVTVSTAAGSSAAASCIRNGSSPTPSSTKTASRDHRGGLPSYPHGRPAPASP